MTFDHSAHDWLQYLNSFQCMAKILRWWLFNCYVSLLLFLLSLFFVISFIFFVIKQGNSREVCFCCSQLFCLKMVLWATIHVNLLWWAPTWTDRQANGKRQTSTDSKEAKGKGNLYNASALENSLLSLATFQKWRKTSAFSCWHLCSSGSLKSVWIWSFSLRVAFNFWSTGNKVCRAQIKTQLQLLLMTFILAVL